EKLVPRTRSYRHEISADLIADNGVCEFAMLGELSNISDGSIRYLVRGCLDEIRSDPTIKEGEASG
ncbi:MAG: hypothetical protein L6R42_004796, partial [Xanthoria sp. 1 TBL-2021]